jgi:conjugative transfer region protein TrbK
MSRNAKIAGVAALGGIMLAVALAGSREPHEPQLEAVLPVLEEGEQEKRLARELERCATLTMPDSGCEAAWAEKRRRFFGKDADAPAPAEQAKAAVDVAGEGVEEGIDGSRADEAIRPELPGPFVPADQAGSTAP